jgi:MFS family permease
MLKRVLTAAVVLKMLYGFTIGLYLYVYPLTFSDLFNGGRNLSGGEQAAFLLNIVFVFDFILEALLDAPLGAYADIRGYRPTLEGAFIFRGLYFLALILTVSLIHHPRFGFPVAFLSVTLFAISYTLWSGANSAWLYDSLKEAGAEDSYLKYFSRIQTAYFVCFIGGAILSAFLYFKHVPELAYGLGAVFSLVGAFFIRIYLPEPKSKKARSTYKKQVISVISDAWRYCLSTSEIYYLLQLGAFVALLFNTVNYLWPPYARNALGLGFGWKWISVIIVMTLGSLLGNAYIGTRWKKDQDNELIEWRHYLLSAFVLGLPILLLSILAISGYNQIWLFLVLVAVSRIAFGAKDAPYEALMNRLITRVSQANNASRPPAEIRATILSSASIFNAILMFFFFMPVVIFRNGTIKGWILPAALLVIATILTHRKGSKSSKGRREQWK